MRRRGFLALFPTAAVVAGLTLLAAALAPAAGPYTPPVTHRADILLDSGWRFIRQEADGAQSPAFDDSPWSPVELPHTWNNLDGQDGGNNYYRGVGWYRKHCHVSGDLAGRQFFLKFDGGFSVVEVWLNGSYLGQHQGGFAAFTFDATPHLKVGADNLIAVKVSNAMNTNLPPLSADFTFFGGLYRDAHLLVTDPVHISPLDYSSAGVYLKPTQVSSRSADLQVTTILSNAGPGAAAIVLRTLIADAATNLVTTLTNRVTLPPGTVSNVVAATMIPRPHLWDGLADPYLYQAFVEVWLGGKAVDVIAQPLGFRSFSVDPDRGAFLNGHYLDLRGVSLHQDWADRGWAIGEAERLANFGLLKEIGATALRLSHYEHAERTYQLADQAGLVLWSEIPVINNITESPAFYASAQRQLRELIRQRYNHPAVVCWGLFNEITLKRGPVTTNLVSQLARLEIEEDPTRPSTVAVNANDREPSNWYSALTAFNKYFGWYDGAVNDFGPWADAVHANYPGRPIGISEYGAGANIAHHCEEPVAQPAPDGKLHPEEYQNLYHEAHWLQMKARPFLWCKFVWNLCDFASDARNEGGTPGRNDKGLVTYDRRIRKDAFYWYQANWTTNPMVHLTGHTFTNRLTNAVTAKVYANCEAVELLLNGVSQGARVSTNRIFTWPVTLRRGTNWVVAIGTAGGVRVSDSLIWIAPTQPPMASIISPEAPVVYLDSTNEPLPLSAAADDPQPDPPPLTTRWTRLSGPNAVAFGAPGALRTTARFGAEGVYGLGFLADNGAATLLERAVVVGPQNEVREGLLGWWKMDESGGMVARDASGNGRDARVIGALFQAGRRSNALHFDGPRGGASFAWSDPARLTIAAWVRADGHGESLYPHLLDTPAYRLFFRFDRQGTNGFDFATHAKGQAGDWFSGAGTISTGAWYHIAARYDGGSLTNLPALFVNGVKLTPNTITSPSAAPSRGSGVAWIANSSARDRGWNGAIDDLRIYDRLLDDAEIRVLAAPVRAVASRRPAARQSDLSYGR